MGFLDLFRPKPMPDVLPWGRNYDQFTDDIDYRLNGLPVGSYGPGVPQGRISLRSMTPAQMWTSQPNFRSVVSFLGRNIAQLGLHTFERVDEDRRRDRTSPVASLLRRPNPTMTTYELVDATVIDRALYDIAYWAVLRDADAPSGWALWRLPPAWVTPKAASAFTYAEFAVRAPGAKESVTFKASEVLVMHGYNATDPRTGSSAVQSLRTTLEESLNAAEYRARVWERGGKVSAVIKRPADAAQWSKEAADRFREDWKSTYAGDGLGTGGTPVLEDGMSLERVDFSASDQQYVEGQKLTLATVAAAFHVNPTMVGLLDNANYSNVREFRRMLYGDTLGPLIASIEDRINTFLLPMLGMDPDRFYVEFNIAEKLQGSFEEQAAVMSTMVGAPIMTRDEGRAKFNLPALGGAANDLVTPLNVLVGGQASPRDSGSQNRRSGPGPLVKGRAPVSHEEKVAEVVAGFFKRQERAVRSALGAKAAGDWWDADRWDGELGDDLYRLAVMVSGSVAKSTLDSIGFSPDEFDEDRTLAWLKEVSRRSAESINATTRAKIADALDADEPGEALDSMFEAQSSRALEVAVSTVTLLSGFASVEAAQQVAPERATKTWVVTSSNPRASHAAMDGETVPLSENFSNGAAWPGDGANLSADDIAGCQCSLVIDVA